MAASTWPLSMNLLVEGSVDDVLADGRIRTPTEQGPPLMRPRSYSAIRLLRGSMFMTDAQLATMKTFVNTTLVMGTLPFWFEDPIDSSTILVQFGESLPTANFVSKNKWLVTLNLEVLP